MTNKKTEGECLFEKYLVANKLDFVYEATIGKKTPDYIVKTLPEILVEVKDLGLGDLDKDVMLQLKKSGKAEWSNQSIYSRARSDISKAHEQLVEFKNKYPCIVLLYKSSNCLTSNLDTQTVLGAMYGDINLVWKTTNSGEMSAYSQFDSKKAKLRKKQATTISAVAVLESIRPNEHLFTKPLKLFLSSNKINDKNRTEQYMDKVKEIEGSYPNIDLHQEVLRLRIIHNLYATVKLPIGLINGKYNEEIAYNKKTGRFEQVNFNFY